MLVFLGLFDDAPVTDSAKTSADILQFLLETKLAMKASDKDMIVMLHEINYERNQQQHFIKSSLMVKGEDSLRTAMAKTVGLPLGIAADDDVAAFQVDLDQLFEQLGHVLAGLGGGVGTQLLDRSGRRVEPTEAGLRLFRGAQRLLQLEEQMLDEIASDAAGALAGTLSIGASTGPAAVAVPGRIVTRQPMS